MINAVSFAGREEMLTKNLKKAATQHNYASPFVPTEIVAEAKKAVETNETKVATDYFSPFSPSEVKRSVEESENIGNAYASAHGNRLNIFA